MRNGPGREKGHPGWSVYFEDGTWLGGAHGWFRSEEAFYADVYDSAEEAQRWLDDLRRDKGEGGHFDLPAKVIPAWEPLAESLRLEVSQLKQANSLSPSTISDIVFSLEDAIRQLKDD